ncbi:MAG TPA: NAD-dependent epimerase/dehydratase family protein [Jatrophihabitans sp.]|jgi:UDP-glucose 4-epimerase|uniref:NAD-dependent epimerase/dehydratase family protein n=1 Tax=Jatrophihabitans sp. TaxID=1932789 RepID=UPI002DF9D788|nr:NAD-dependent epimerase/dehydratase family protein [Jatrophihabitans sp.]
MVGVVLITGVSRFLGGRLAAQLAADPAVERVIGIDSTPPRTADLPHLGRTEFVRADIRNPLIAKVVTQARVTTVVHAALMASPRAMGGRLPMQEMNVIGTMQLLAACQKSETVQRVVLKSTTAVYGCGPSDPAVFTEEMHPVDGGQVGYAKDAVEVEGFVRGFARRRPDIDVSVLRLTNLIGPTVDTALTRYLRMPVVPSVVGFDPRLQFLHEVDAVETLRLATVSARPGVFNVAGYGVMPLSQITRRAGKLRVPVPGPLIGLAGSLVRNSGVAEVTAEEARYLAYGRAVDTSALRQQFGYTPRYSTAAALDSFLAGQRRLTGLLRAGLGVGSELLQARRERGIAIHGA